LRRSRYLVISHTQGSQRTLAPTLNPVIIFLRQFFTDLFTKFASYSQIAACAPEKTNSPLPSCQMTLRLSRLAPRCGTRLALTQQVGQS
jgi:hypothetical protein